MAIRFIMIILPVNADYFILNFHIMSLADIYFDLEAPDIIKQGADLGNLDFRMVIG